MRLGWSAQNRSVQLAAAATGPMPSTAVAPGAPSRPISARSPLDPTCLPPPLTGAAGMIVGYSIISVILVAVSGLMAGLVLGLLSLDK